MTPKPPRREKEGKPPSPLPIRPPFRNRVTAEEGKNPQKQ